MEQDGSDTGSLVVDLVGCEITSEEKKILRNPAIVGVIFFSRNYDNPLQMQQLVASIREIRADLVLCVDQEGGRVQRFTTGLTPIPAMQKIVTWLDAQEDERNSSQFSTRVLSSTAWLLAVELRSMGIDLSFTPVLDIDYKHNDVIGDRAFATEPKRVVTAARQFIGGLQSAGMVAIGKHFPGHGFVKADSHFELPYDRRSVKEIFTADMWVFEELMDVLAGMMPAHVIYSQIDPDCPAGFSMIWLQQYLRQNLSYRGLIVSDDLCMEGAKRTGDIKARANAALNAGCDLLLVCNEPAEAIKLLDSDVDLMTPGNKTVLRMNKPKIPAYSELAGWEEYQSVKAFLLPLFERIEK